MAEACYLMQQKMVTLRTFVTAEPRLVVLC